MTKARRGRPPKQAMRAEGGRISRSKESLGLTERLELEAATWKRRQMNPVGAIWVAALGIVYGPESKHQSAA